MNKIITIAFVCSCIISSTLSAKEISRTWTSTDGTSIEAVLLKYDHEYRSVVIERKDGLRFRFTTDLLSQKDLDYLKDYYLKKLETKKKVEKLKKLNSQELKDSFFNACKNADLDKLKLLLRVDSNLVKSRYIISNDRYDDENPHKWDNEEYTYTGLLWLLDKADPSEERYQCVKLLLKNGADANASTAEKGTDSARNTIPYSNRRIDHRELELLLDHGADPDFGFCVNRSTLLINTVEKVAEGQGTKDDYQTINLLIEHGSNPRQDTVALNKGDKTISARSVAKRSDNEKLLEILGYRKF